VSCEAAAHQARGRANGQPDEIFTRHQFISMPTIQ
jgi:hypothetical protein